MSCYSTIEIELYNGRVIPFPIEADCPFFLDDYLDDYKFKYWLGENEISDLRRKTSHLEDKIYFTVIETGDHGIKYIYYDEKEKEMEEKEEEIIKCVDCGAQVMGWEVEDKNEVPLCDKCKEELYWQMKDTDEVKY